MHDWVVSTKDDLDKFKNEFENYFDLRFCLIYYVYTFVALMVDQRAKNMFLTYWAETGKWQPWLYDNDTSFGINNEGELVFDYYHEDIDIVNNENVYNGQNSTLWVNFRQAFATEIQETYQDLRNNNLITYEKFVEFFITNGSDKWSASVYNEDSDYKYISMLKSDNDASNLYQVRGTGEEHFKYFVENRLNYCDSKWYASDYADNYVALRVYTPTSWAGVEPNPSITITPYSNMYAGVRYKANGTLLQQRAEKNVPVTFSPPSGTDLSYTGDFSDTESAIYGASEISSLGDLAPLYCGTLNVSKATKLVDLKVGDGTEGYVNDHLHFLSVGTNRLLKMVDVRNCPQLTDPLALSGCPNIEEIYATGSGITGIELADSGYLKVIELPATLTNLTLKNQLYIETLTIEGNDSIRTLWIENCPTIDTLSLVNNATSLERLRLTDVNWKFDDASFLIDLYNTGIGGIDENGTNIDNMHISGKCHIETLTGAEMAELNEMYPYLEITYTNLTAQLIFMSEDGSEEYCRQTIINGGNGTNPVSDGTISTPTKSSTAQYRYSFSGWSLKSGGSASTAALNSVTADRYVYAAFSSTTRSYTARFYNDNTLLESQTVLYNKDASYSGDTSAITKTGVDDPELYEFIGWNPSSMRITGDTDFYAQFSYAGSIKQTWEEISAISAAGTSENYFAVGDCKEITLSGTIGTLDIDTTLYVYILGFNHNSEIEGAGIQFGGFKTAAGADGKNVCLVDSMYGSYSTDGTLYFNMNHSSNTNSGGWQGCDLRYDILGSVDVNDAQNAGSTTATNPVANTLMSCLPAELRAVMKPITKYTNNTGGSGDTEAKVTSTVDYLPLLAEYEIFGTRSYANSYEQNYQKQYAYFAAGNSKVKYKHSATSSSAFWWERSATYYNGSYFCCVYIGGDASSNSARYSCGLAPAFMV